MCWWFDDVDDDDDDNDVKATTEVRAGSLICPGPGPGPGPGLAPLVVVVCSSSEVDGLRGRLRRSKEDVSSESTANERNSADLLLTHNVHLYSTSRVR